MPDSRRLVVTENITANGVIEFTDDWFDPGGQGDLDDLLAVMQAQMATEEALLLGRQTFEDFRGYWPLQTDDTTGTHPVGLGRGQQLFANASAVPRRRDREHRTTVRDLRSNTRRRTVNRGGRPPTSKVALLRPVNARKTVRQ